MASDNLDAVLYEMDDAEHEQYANLQSQMDDLLADVHARVKQSNSGRGDYHDESDSSSDRGSDEDDEYSEEDIAEYSEQDPDDELREYESDDEAVEPQAGSGKQSPWMANVALSLALVTMAIFGH
jgi:hypothetical protein